MSWADSITILRDNFPSITESNSSPTSPATGDYNCIAWAYGKDDVWFEPDHSRQYYWPIPHREYSIDAYCDSFFEKKNRLSLNIVV